MEKEKLREYFEKTPVMLERLFVRANELWEIIPEIHSFLKINTEKAKMEGIRVGDVYLDQDVSVGKGTIIEHGAMIKGPAIIGSGCVIRSGAYLRDGVFVGDGSIIGHCSEVKNSIIMSNSAIPHFNYVGDSIIGNNTNLGAGAILANSRFDGKEIVVDEKPTGLKKFGSILGDDCKLGCNTALSPGTQFKKGVFYFGKTPKNGVWDKKKIKTLFKKR